jgi:hypothetical protein
MHSQILNKGESQFIPNAGHMPSTDQPEMVISRVTQFLHSNSAVNMD